MFSVNVMLGANKVVEAHDLIADNNAPKNNTCMTNGICVITKVGSTFCGSSAISAVACSGMMIMALTTENMGTNANKM